MIALQPSPMRLLHHSPALSDDVEMLQTDVMRFFAILCLCLMAIFALVKALPMAPPAARPTMAEPMNLTAAAQSLQNQIAALRKKLAGLVNDIDTKQQIQSELRSRIKNETQNLKKIQATLEWANQKVNQRHARNQDIPLKPSEPDTAKPAAKDGYILRFASDAALQTLIASGQVYFYAVTGKKAWQLRLTGGRAGYVSTKRPVQIYEMETATVPIEYATAFEQQVAAFDPTAVTWGVTLPAQTTASINRLTKRQNGGDLVIMPDGEVVLN